jgi:hypothetical protein
MKMHLRIVRRDRPVIVEQWVGSLGRNVRNQACPQSQYSHSDQNAHVDGSYPHATF